jgi:hypothetical protein
MSKWLSFKKASTTCDMGQKGYMGQIVSTIVMFVATLPILQMNAKLAT